MRRIALALLLTGTLTAALVAVMSPNERAQALADPKIALAGDIACAPPATPTSSKCHDDATANLLVAGNYDAVLPLGDEQYECGQLSAFNQVYDDSWGQVKNVSRPAVGDNEYAGGGCTTPGASGYFTYFGSAATPQQPGCTQSCKGYYSYDVGNWHVVALNSECSQPGVGGCGGTAPQVQWLKSDLAAHPNACTLAYFHRPYWSDKGGVVARTAPFVKALFNAGAELIVVGHQHVYERFAPMTPASQQNANGIRQFTVGTGGKSLSALAATPPAGSQARSRTFGILELTLHPSSYDWRFVPEAGKSFTDSGTQACH